MTDMAPAAQADISDIEALVHRYDDAVCRNDETSWASCWVEDAEWVLTRGRTASGRAAVVELWRASMAANRSVEQHSTPASLAVDGAQATGTWDVGSTYVRAGGEPGVLRATYEDLYRRTDAGWRIVRRRLTAQYQGSPDEG